MNSNIMIDTNKENGFEKDKLPINKFSDNNIVIYSS
jgi:hypothetical protein